MGRWGTSAPFSIHGTSRSCPRRGSRALSASSSPAQPAVLDSPYPRAPGVSALELRQRGSRDSREASPVSFVIHGDWGQARPFSRRERERPNRPRPRFGGGGGMSSGPLQDPALATGLRGDVGSGILPTGLSGGKAHRSFRSQLRSGIHRVSALLVAPSGSRVSQSGRRGEWVARPRRHAGRLRGRCLLALGVPAVCAGSILHRRQEVPFHGAPSVLQGGWGGGIRRCMWRGTVTLVGEGKKTCLFPKVPTQSMNWMLC